MNSEKLALEAWVARDAMMADNLRYIIKQERPRGRVFAFAQNVQLKRG